jgi:protein gp37
MDISSSPVRKPRKIYISISCDTIHSRVLAIFEVEILPILPENANITSNALASPLRLSSVFEDSPDNFQKKSCLRIKFLCL